MRSVVGFTVPDFKKNTEPFKFCNPNEETENLIRNRQTHFKSGQKIRFSRCF